MNHLSRLTKLAALVCLAYAAGCASESDPEASDDDLRASKRVQMNDVSVLLPIVKAPRDLSLHLAPTSAGRGGILLSQALYDAAIPPQNSGGGGPDVGATRFPPTITYANMRMVAFRLDPCFANLGPVTNERTCENQLRIIFQPLTASGPGVSVADAAIHAFYTLTRDELKQAVGEITALRIANVGTKSLGALAVHPVVVDQGMSGRMAKGLNAIVLKYAGASNLASFTVFRGMNGGFSWSFEGFDVKRGTVARQKIPTLPTDTPNVSFTSGGASEPTTMEGSFFPPTNATGLDNMQLLANRADADAAAAPARQAAFDAATRVLNPNFHSPKTMDCASCHIAEAATELGRAKWNLKASKTSYTFKADATYLTNKDVARTTKFDPEAGTLNVHIFSYGGGGAMIGARAVNETASVVAYLNGTVLR